MSNIFKLIKYIFLFGFILFIDMFIYEPYALKITSYNLENAKLSGLKIVFVSDFHIAPYPWEKWRLRRIISMINQQNPDLVILGGDYVNGHNFKSTMPPKDIIMSLQSIKSLKVAVLGNHDSYYGKEEVISAFKKAEIPLLNNSNIKLNLQNKEVYIVGVSDYDTDNPDLQKAMKDVKSPQIFVAHSPDSFADLNNNVDIAFAGHTHGGQIVLPFLGALIVNIKSGRKYTYGIIKDEGKTMIISSGLGTSVLPIRFNNLPEIVVVNFKK